MLGTLPNWTVTDIGGDEGGSSPRLKKLMLLRKVIGVEKQTEEIDRVDTHPSKYTLKGYECFPLRYGPGYAILDTRCFRTGVLRELVPLQR